MQPRLARLRHGLHHKLVAHRLVTVDVQFRLWFPGGFYIDQSAEFRLADRVLVPEIGALCVHTQCNRLGLGALPLRHLRTVASVAWGYSGSRHRWRGRAIFGGAGGLSQILFRYIALGFAAIRGAAFRSVDRQARQAL